MDKENELWKFFAAVRPKSHNNLILSFWLPYQRLGQGRLVSPPWESDAVKTLLPPFPPLQTLLPSPIQLPLKCFVPPLGRAGLRPAPHGTGPDGCLPELDMFPPVAMSCVYGICAFVLRCFFFCSQTVLQMEHSLGVKIFFSSSLSSCKSCIF